MDKSKIDNSARVDGELIVEGSCRIGVNTILMGEVKLGNNVSIANNAVIYGPVKIGNSTYIGDNTVIGHPIRKDLKEFIKTGEMRELIAADGCTIGNNTIVRAGCIIYANSQIGDQVEFGHTVLVREQTKIGNNTKVGTDTVIEGYSTIGSNVNIQSMVFIPLYSTVEDDVFLGPNCKLTNDKYVDRKEYELKGPVIKKRASIGANAIIMPDIIIGEGAIIGAGAVVTKNVPANQIWMGIPAKFFKDVPKDWNKK
ncbi:MAG: N-acetyltransferase [Candidatus Helarchaeota archaeon]|nr:N-acetyltransferase [Candidatus Helarchaeota archaeon]